MFDVCARAVVCEEIDYSLHIAKACDCGPLSFTDKNKKSFYMHCYKNLMQSCFVPVMLDFER